MRLFIILLLTPAILLPACSRPKPTRAKDSQDGTFIHVSKEDPAMSEAITKAKASVGDFVQAFHTRKLGTNGFAVKKPYPVAGGDAEHMWINVKEEKDGVIKGVIDNEAEETKEVKLGDAVVLTVSEISDWKYQQGRKLIGGYTIRYMFSKMTPTQQADFLKETGLEF